jgi:hypothetical protein
MARIFDFKNINWGPDDAKGDLQLQNYFLRTPDFDRLIEGKKRFVIGRKGTGKTEILQKIVIESQNNPLFFCKELTSLKQSDNKKKARDSTSEPIV